MNRRRVLSALGGSAAMLSLAGCAGSGDSDEDPGNGDEESEENGEADTEENGEAETETDSAADVETDELIASAGGSLEEAVHEFDTTIEDDPLADDSSEDDSESDRNSADEDVPTVDTDRIETLVEDAEDDIETARSGASDEQLDTLESLETLAQFLRELVPALSAVNDAMTNFEEGDRHMENEEYGAAVDVYEQSESDIELANDEATVARATFDELESGAFESIDELDHGELTETVDDLEGALELFDVLITGMRQMIDGMIPLQAGNEALDANRFQTATAEFEAASDQFYRAYTTLDEGATDVSEDDREDVLQLACETEGLSDASEYLAQGSEALADGDQQRGMEYFTRADEALDRCEGDYGNGDGTGAAMPANVPPAPPDRTAETAGRAVR